MNSGATQSPPAVSVLVCTCNRRENVLPTLRSIQACGDPDFELVLLDQSHDDLTELAVRDLCSADQRLRYQRLERPNKPQALNRGLELARGRYILLTDDDCEVRSGWIGAMVRTLESNQTIGCVFGDVEPGPCDSTQGYIPNYRISHAVTIQTLGDFLRMPGWVNFGMGANLAFRASALHEIGGWDPCIGPGALFASGDDHDTVARIICAGHALALCPQSHVVHYGLRYWKSVGADQARYGLGMGASFAKQLRMGTYYPGPVRVFADGLRRSLQGLARGERSLGLAYPRHWIRGVWLGLQHPIDRNTRCFIPSAGEVGRKQDNRAAKVVLRSDQNAVSDQRDSKA